MARVQHVLTSKHPKTAKDMELLASLTVAKRDHDPSISLDQPSVSYENILLERFETWKWRDRLVAKSPKITSPCLIAFGPCGLLNFFFVCCCLVMYFSNLTFATYRRHCGSTTWPLICSVLRLGKP